MAADYIDIPQTFGVAVRLDTSVCKEFLVQAHINASANSGAWAIVPYDTSGNRLDGATKTPGTDEEYVLSYPNTAWQAGTANFGGSYQGSDTTIPIYIRVIDDVKYVDVFHWRAASGNLRLKEITVKSLDQNPIVQVMKNSFANDNSADFRDNLRIVTGKHLHI